MFTKRYQFSLRRSYSSEWISVLPWQSDWKSNYWFERIADMISERGEDYFDAEQIFDYVPPQETVEWGFCSL